jgi:mitochondrial-processing peptidase subunit beta
VQLAKNAAKSAILSGLASSSGLCEDIGRQLLVYGRVLPRNELFARIDAVTPEAVRECAGRLLQDQDIAIPPPHILEPLLGCRWH